ncbi:hypothetical protein MBLNU13_g06861t1 [Cladosporium sp. NU13]
MATVSTFPLNTTRLTQIATDACASALSTATSYQHDSTAAWNNAIINSILQSLISETSALALHEPSENTVDGSRYKFAVNSTIIQHLSDPRSAGSEGEASEERVGEVQKSVGRRGMHSASGAYWNNERDGMWSFKYEGGESKGMDIVVSIMWIGV